MKNYFYRLLRNYLSLYILPSSSVVEINPQSVQLIGQMPSGKVSFINPPRSSAEAFPQDQILAFDAIKKFNPEYIFLGGIIHEERDIQKLFNQVHKLCESDTRLILTYYSNLWSPLVKLASLIKIRRKTPISNWLAHEDIDNLLRLENFEIIRVDHKILCPIYIPLISNFLNRYLAPLPIFKNFCLVNIAIARPIFPLNYHLEPSVSIIVPARNEAGNIEDLINRVPQMGPQDELIFIEGNSTDNTWEIIEHVYEKYTPTKKIIIAKQPGKGKGDAVRTGFNLANNEILMILDADMTVPPEDLPKFYKAIVEGKGEFINGTRLVYPMEKKAMRFFNLIGNKFFAMSFSYVLGQRFKDTLCGTKVISKKSYQLLSSNRSYFGEFDPFGDFDLIFGAARMGLKIVEVPISYRERTYGETNISRWRHGAILFSMLLFASHKFLFI